MNNLESENKPRYSELKEEVIEGYSDILSLIVRAYHAACDHVMNYELKENEFGADNLSSRVLTKATAILDNVPDKNYAIKSNNQYHNIICYNGIEIKLNKITSNNKLVTKSRRRLATDEQQLSLFNLDEESFNASIIKKLIANGFYVGYFFNDAKTEIDDIRVCFCKENLQEEDDFFYAFSINHLFDSSKAATQTKSQQGNYPVPAQNKESVKIKPSENKVE